MTQLIYQRLAEHLDRLLPARSRPVTRRRKAPAGRLFTPQEAELALHLTLDREEAYVIAERAVSLWLRRSDGSAQWPTRASSSPSSQRVAPPLPGGTICRRHLRVPGQPTE